MTNKFELALGAICARLANTPGCTPELKHKLESAALEDATAAAMEVIAALSQTPKVLIEMDPEGGDPNLWADRAVDVALLRMGADLQDYEPADIFRIEDHFEAGQKIEVVGFRGYPVVTVNYVRRTFDAIDFHKVERAVQVQISQPEIMARRFRIDWVQGYGAREAETHPIAWFTTDLGFEHDTIRALVALDVGQTHNEYGPVEKVSITRIE